MAAAGCEVLELSAENDRPAIVALLDELGRRRLTNILVEGGAEVLGSFLDAAEIDEVHVFVAPMFVGGGAAKGPVAGLGVARLADALRLASWSVERLEPDLFLHGWR